MSSHNDVWHINKQAFIDKELYRSNWHLLVKTYIFLRNIRLTGCTCNPGSAITGEVSPVLYGEYLNKKERNWTIGAMLICATLSCGGPTSGDEGIMTLDLYYNNTFKTALSLKLNDHSDMVYTRCAVEV